MTLAEKNLQLLRSLSETKTTAVKRAPKTTIMTKNIYFNRLTRDRGLSFSEVGEMIGRTDGGIYNYKDAAEIPMTVELACKSVWDDLAMTSHSDFVMCIVKCKKEHMDVFKNVAEATGGSFCIVKV